MTETHSTRSPSPQPRSSLWRRERRAQSSVRTARWNWNLVSSHSISFGWFVHQNIQPSPTTLSTNFFISPPPTCVSWRSPLLFTWRTRPGHGSLLSRTCEWPSPPCHQGLKKSVRPDRHMCPTDLLVGRIFIKKSLILNVSYNLWVRFRTMQLSHGQFSAEFLFPLPHLSGWNGCVWLSPIW